MRDLDVKRLNSIAEELEKRVYRLESQPKKTESEIIEESFEGLLFKQDNNVKRYNFIAKKSEYAILSLQIKSSLESEVTCEVYCNERLEKTIVSTLPITSQIPIMTKIGENQLKIAVKNELNTANYTVDIQLSIQGQVKVKPKKYKLGILLAEVCYITYGDTLQCVSSETMETTTCYTDKDAIGAGFLSENYNIYLLKNGEEKILVKHTKLSNASYSSNEIDYDADEYEVEVYNGVTYVFGLKDNKLYMLSIASDGSIINTDLNITAKRFSIFSGDSGRYICYTDLKGNCYAIRNKSHITYATAEIYSLGKLENANLCEENGELVVIYKQGHIVMKKPVATSGEAVAIGVGEEGIISRTGAVLVRRGNKLIKN